MSMSDLSTRVDALKRRTDQLTQGVQLSPTSAAGTSRSTILTTTGWPTANALRRTRATPRRPAHLLRLLRRWSGTATKYGTGRWRTPAHLNRPAPGPRALVERVGDRNPMRGTKSGTKSGTNSMADASSDPTRDHQSSIFSAVAPPGLEPGLHLWTRILNRNGGTPKARVLQALGRQPDPNPSGQEWTRVDRSGHRGGRWRRVRVGAHRELVNLATKLGLILHGSVLRRPSWPDGAALVLPCQGRARTYPAS